MFYFDDKEQELLLKRIIRQTMENHLSNLQENKPDNNNSFVFLEKGTLNIVLSSMLMNANRRTGDEVNGDSQLKIIEELEKVLVENKKDFEELITLLNEKQ